MFAEMSGTASIPSAAVIGKVRRGEGGTRPGQGEGERVKFREISIKGCK